MKHWQRYYLRAPDEAEMMAALDAAGWRGVDPDTEEPITVTVSSAHRLKLLPGLMERTGDMLTDDEGREYPEQVPAPGYHANVIMRPGTPLPDALQTFTITPNTPRVKYAV